MIRKEDYDVRGKCFDFKPIPLTELMTSTSLAFGEAYMNGDLKIEGDLYYALDHFLGQMDQFSTDGNYTQQ